MVHNAFKLPSKQIYEGKKKKEKDKTSEIRASLKFQEGGRRATGQLSGQKAQIYLRGNADFLSKFDLESKPEEAIFELIKQATKADEVNIGIAFNFKKASGDPLVSDDDDEGGDSKNVGSLHYCTSCGKENVLERLDRCGACQTLAPEK